MKFIQCCTVFLGFMLFTLSPLAAHAEVTIDNSETEISMALQEYDTASFYELPGLSGNSQQEAFKDSDYRNPSLLLLEHEVKGQFLLPLNDYWDDKGGNKDFFVATYPFDDENLMQFVVTADVKNSAFEHGVFRDIASFAFRRSDNAYLDIDYALTHDKKTADDILNSAQKLLAEKKITPSSLELKGFLQSPQEGAVVMTYLLRGVFDKHEGEGIQPYTMTLTPNEAGYVLEFVDAFAHNAFVGDLGRISLSEENPAGPLHFDRPSFEANGVRKYERINTAKAEEKLPMPKEQEKYWKGSLAFKRNYDLMQLALMNSYNLLPEKINNALLKVVNSRVTKDVADSMQHTSEAEAYASAYIDASRYVAYVIGRDGKNFDFYVRTDANEIGGYVLVHTNEAGVKEYSFTAYSFIDPANLDRIMLRVSPDNSVKIYNWETTEYDTLKDITLTNTRDSFEVHIPESEGNYIQRAFGEKFEKGDFTGSGIYSRIP